MDNPFRNKKDDTNDLDVVSDLNAQIGADNPFTTGGNASDTGDNPFVSLESSQHNFSEYNVTISDIRIIGVTADNPLIGSKSKTKSKLRWSIQDGKLDQKTHKGSAYVVGFNPQFKSPIVVKASSNLRTASICIMLMLESKQKISRGVSQPLAAIGINKKFKLASVLSPIKLSKGQVLLGDNLDDVPLSIECEIEITEVDVAAKSHREAIASMTAGTQGFEIFSSPPGMDVDKLLDGVMKEATNWVNAASDLIKSVQYSQLCVPKLDEYHNITQFEFRVTVTYTRTSAKSKKSS